MFQASYELELKEIRQAESKFYHPMETRYDLYGELAPPEPGSLGPALSQEQPATEELWRCIDDLDFHTTSRSRKGSAKNAPFFLRHLSIS